MDSAAIRMNQSQRSGLVRLLGTQAAVGEFFTADEADELIETLDPDEEIRDLHRREDEGDGQ